MKTTEELLRRELKRRYATDNGSRLAALVCIALAVLVVVALAHV